MYNSGNTHNLAGGESDTAPVPWKHTQNNTDLKWEQAFLPTYKHMRQEIRALFLETVKSYRE